MYLSRQVGSEQGSPSAPAMWSEHDLEKMSDHVFKAFDREGSGYVSREHGEQLLNRLNLCGTDDIEKPGQTTTWEHHWNKIDDGSGP
ncbi:unnamed protein product [Rotaria sordida]|nr:unnamed protein product [Rotaria sordida]